MDYFFIIRKQLKVKFKFCLQTFKFNLIMGDCASRTQVSCQPLTKLAVSSQNQNYSHAKAGKKIISSQIPSSHNQQVANPQNNHIDNRLKLKEKAINGSHQISNQFFQPPSQDKDQIRMIIQELIRKSKNGPILLKDKNESLQASVGCPKDDNDGNNGNAEKCQWQQLSINFLLRPN